MAGVAQQRERDLAALSAEVKAAYEQYDSAAEEAAGAKAAWKAAEGIVGAREVAELKGHYDALKEKEERRKERYEDLKETEKLRLQAELLGAGPSDAMTANELAGLFMEAFFTRPPSSTSTQAKDGYREDALVAYEGTRAPVSVEDMITGEELAVKDAIAAHIYQQRWPPVILERMGMSMHDARNIVLTRKEVESKLDKSHICLMPQDDGSIRLKVLRKSMLSPKGDEQSVLHSHSNLTWASIDGRCLQSRTGALPANRVCGLHALWAIKDAVREGGLKEGEVLVPHAAWSSPRGDEGLLQNFLRASCNLQLGVEEPDSLASNLQTPRSL